MRVANRVRRIYERRPYPPPKLRGARPPLPPIEWINAISEKSASDFPARILVAGCGVGTEAFGLARWFPEAEVVGVDFSPRSIATARKLRRKADGGERVRFEVADITAPGLGKVAGSGFDLVSCHGVLSYVAEPVLALRNLAARLKPGGLLVLGVNGAAHPSARWRRELSGFGISPEEFRESRRLREVLRAFESLSNSPLRMAEREAGYLAGDLFGPLNHALTLEAWSDMLRQSGLQLLGSYDAFFAIRPLLNRDLHSPLIPRSRADVAELVDSLHPATFHQLVLSRRRPVKIPWSNGRKLMRLRPALTGLYRIRWPGRSGSWHGLRSVRLESEATGTKVNLRVPRWEVELLRGSDGERSLGDLLRAVKPSVSTESFREAMFLLYHLGLINLLRARQGR